VLALKLEQLPQTCGLATVAASLTYSQGGALSEQALPKFIVSA
jgi:hypothetical protein